VGGSLTTRVLTYPGTSNKMSKVTIGAATERDFTYDAAGNIATDTRSGTLFAYGTNARNRLDGDGGGLAARHLHLQWAGAARHSRAHQHDAVGHHPLRARSSGQKTKSDGQESGPIDAGMDQHAD
jgi:hypothetical protein